MPLRVVKLINQRGTARVLDGKVGMTFIVDSFTDRVNKDGQMAHVRDYRNFGPNLGREFQIWSIPPDGYEEILA